MNELVRPIPHRRICEQFFQLRAPKLQIAVRQDFLEIGTGLYSFYPTFFQNLTPRTATVHSNAEPKKSNIYYYFEFPTTPIVHDNLVSRHRHQTQPP